MRVEKMLLIVMMLAGMAMGAHTQTLLFTLDTPNPQVEGRFGESVAVGYVDGDEYTDIAVGAYYEDEDGNYRQGRAYVFSGVDQSVMFTLTTPNPQLTAYFGKSVAMGDVNGDGSADIAVGAYGEDVGANSNQGRAYVFSGTNGSLLYTLDFPGSQASTGFGGSVAIGDVDGDLKADVLVAASIEDVGANADQGRVYVFSGDDGSLIHTLDTPSPRVDAHFGSSIAAGDVDGDGKADIAVGAILGGDAPGPGEAYVFSGDDGLLMFPLIQPDPTTLDKFGSATAIGDVDGDGKGEIAVGAFDQDHGGHPQEGRTYIFSGVDGSLLFILDNPSGAENAEHWFGYAVALGDVHGDERADMVIDMGGQVGDNLFQGRIYSFAAPDGEPLFTLDTPNPQNLAEFGTSLALGDVDSDGMGDIVAGAYGEDVGGNDYQGRVYVFTLQSTPVPTLSEWGLILFSMLLLSLVTAAVTRRNIAMAASGPGAHPRTSMTGAVFFPVLYLKALTVTLGLAAVILVTAIAMSGALPIRDIVGTVLSAGIAAYIAHLWIYRCK